MPASRGRLVELTTGLSPASGERRFDVVGGNEIPRICGFEAGLNLPAKPSIIFGFVPLAPHVFPHQASLMVLGLRHRERHRFASPYHLMRLPGLHVDEPL